MVHRPRLGARILVRSYVKRYLKALYNEIQSWQTDHQMRAANLLWISICYVEEFMTQHMDHLLVALYKACLNKDDIKIVHKVKETLKLLGRYTLPKNYGQFLSKAVGNDLASYYGYT